MDKGPPPGLGPRVPANRVSSVDSGTQNQLQEDVETSCLASACSAFERHSDAEAVRQLWRLASLRTGECEDRLRAECGPLRDCFDNNSGGGADGKALLEANPTVVAVAPAHLSLSRESLECRLGSAWHHNMTVASLRSQFGDTNSTARSGQTALLEQALRELEDPPHSAPGSSLISSASPASQRGRLRAPGDQSSSRSLSVRRYNRAVILMQLGRHDDATRLLAALLAPARELAELSSASSTSARGSALALDCPFVWVAQRTCVALLDSYLFFGRLSAARKLLAFAEGFLLPPQGAPKSDSCRMVQLLVAYNLHEPERRLMPRDQLIKLLQVARANVQVQAKTGLKQTTKVVASAETAPGHSLPSASAVATFSRAQMVYSLGTFEKSEAILCSPPPSIVAQKLAGGCDAVMFFNNLGCCHFRMHRYHSARFYFAKALDHLGATEDTVRPHDIGLRLLHNLASAHLLCGEPTKSINCFTKLLARSEFARKDPRVWLRLAEATLMQTLKPDSIFASVHSTSTRSGAPPSVAMERTSYLRGRDEEFRFGILAARNVLHIIDTATMSRIDEISSAIPEVAQVSLLRMRAHALLLSSLFSLRCNDIIPARNQASEIFFPGTELSTSTPVALQVVGSAIAASAMLHSGNAPEALELLSRKITSSPGVLGAEDWDHSLALERSTSRPRFASLISVLSETHARALAAHNSAVVSTFVALDARVPVEVRAAETLRAREMMGQAAALARTGSIPEAIWLQAFWSLSNGSTWDAWRLLHAAGDPEAGAPALSVWSELLAEANAST